MKASGNTYNRGVARKSQQPYPIIAHGRDTQVIKTHSIPAPPTAPRPVNVLALFAHGSSIEIRAHASA
ncbi:hypothetical protein BURKHO8Y_110147 [Burkholderia sp. 8Y]|nr:hypothetical protein BURKHO8Y_110147 [Burkholderia sp. 8Y]